MGRPHVRNYDAGILIEAADGTDIKLPLRKIPPGEPGELRSSPKVAEQFTNSCRNAAPGAEIRPKLYQHWPVVANFWPSLAKLCPLWHILGPNAWTPKRPHTSRTTVQYGEPATNARTSHGWHNGATSNRAVICGGAHELLFATSLIAPTSYTTPHRHRHL